MSDKSVELSEQFQDIVKWCSRVSGDNSHRQVDAEQAVRQ